MLSDGGAVDDNVLKHPHPPFVASSVDRLAYQRWYRYQNNDSCTKKYEKTPKGFLMRLYRNMKSRIEGVQKIKHHLYSGKALIDKDAFYLWAVNNPDFVSLYADYVASGFERKLAPSVDRKDSTKGYELSNMEWVTMSENSRRGAIARHYRKDFNE